MTVPQETENPIRAWVRKKQQASSRLPTCLPAAAILAMFLLLRLHLASGHARLRAIVLCGLCDWGSVVVNQVAATLQCVAGNSAKCALTVCGLRPDPSEFRVRRHCVRFASPAPDRAKPFLCARKVECAGVIRLFICPVCWGRKIVGALRRYDAHAGLSVDSDSVPAVQTLDFCFLASCFVMKSWRPAVHALLLRFMLLSYCHDRLPLATHFFLRLPGPHFSCHHVCFPLAAILSCCARWAAGHVSRIDFRSFRDLPVAERQLGATVFPTPVVMSFVGFMSYS